MNPVLRWLIKPIYERMKPTLHRRFYYELLLHTRNWYNTKWLGQPIWQNVMDLWVIQETLAEIKPALLIECGTNRGGSALFYANLFDLMDHGRILTIDVEQLHELNHPRVEFLLGSSVDDRIVNTVAHRVAEADGPVMVILDSDHSADHVYNEMLAYSGFVTPGSFMMVQDGVLDWFEDHYAGPLTAIRRFLPGHPEFTVDEERCHRHLVTHHPMGWLQKRSD